MNSSRPSPLRKLIQSACLAVILLVTLVFGSPPAVRAQAPGLFGDALAPYAPAIQARSVFRSRYVHVHLGLLLDERGRTRDASSLPEVTLNLFPDATYTGVIDRVESIGGGSSWIGNLDGVPGGYFYLVVTDGVFIAHVASTRGIYEVSSAGGDLYRIIQIDQSAFAEGNDTLRRPVTNRSAPPEISPTADTGGRIDVMLVYTAAARAAEGGSAAMKARVLLAITEANASYVNAGIMPRLRLVHTQEVSYTERGDMPADLQRLRKKSDGFLDQVQTLRNRYGADMVQLITNSGDFCGLSYLMTDVSTAFAPYAFSVVRRDCMTGYYSTAHEFGHIQGADHDMFVAAADVVAYPYAHGFVHVGATQADSWRTVMAYDFACMAAGFATCTRLQYWSNDLNTFGGDPMGDAFSKNYLVLNNTAYTVANFRANKIAADFNSDFNMDHVGWTPVSGAWSLAGSAYYQTPGVAGRWSSIKHSGNFGDLVYEVRLKRQGTNRYSPNALMVRGMPSSLTSGKLWQSSYLFEYNNAGNIRVRWIDGAGGALDLKGWTRTLAIVRNGWNTLKVVAVGSKLRFYVNDVLVWSGVDSSFLTGRVGIGMYRGLGSTGDRLLVDTASASTAPTAADTVP